MATLAETARVLPASPSSVALLSDICLKSGSSHAIRLTSGAPGCDGYARLPASPLSVSEAQTFLGVYPSVARTRLPPPALTVLLTMTINVGHMTACRQTSSRDRIALYQASVRQWERLPYRVLVLENSGYGNLLKLNSSRIRVITVKLPGNESRGKGYGEAQTLKHAIDSGLLGGAGDYVVKLTGRYAPYERFWEMEEAIREARWDVITVGPSMSDTRFFGCTVAYLRELARECEKRCNDDLKNGAMPTWMMESEMAQLARRAGTRHRNLLEALHVMPTRSGSGNHEVDTLHYSSNITTPECPHGGACMLNHTTWRPGDFQLPGCSVFADGYHCRTGKYKPLACDDGGVSCKHSPHQQGWYYTFLPRSPGISKLRGNISKCKSSKSHPELESLGRPHRPETGFWSDIATNMPLLISLADKIHVACQRESKTRLSWGVAVMPHQNWKCPVALPSPGVATISMVVQMEHNLVSPAEKSRQTLCTNPCCEVGIFPGKVPMVDRPGAFYDVRIVGLEAYSHFDVIVEYNQPNIENMRMSGYFAHVLPRVVYIPPLFFDEFQPGLHQNTTVGPRRRTSPYIEVLALMSNVSPRRKAAIERMRDLGLNVSVISNITGRIALSRLLLRTMVLVDMRLKADYQTVNELRLLPALQRGVVVVSETTPLLDSVAWRDYILWTHYDHLAVTVWEAVTNYDHHWATLYGTSSLLPQVLQQLHLTALDALLTALTPVLKEVCPRTVSGTL
jgi:hypothetical protein